jgi:hypothetical protein
MAKSKTSPLRVLFGGPRLVIVWLLPGHHVPRRQLRLIAPDKLWGGGEQGGISRGKAGVLCS